jgi:hypothetical protein
VGLKLRGRQIVPRDSTPTKDQHELAPQGAFPASGFRHHDSQPYPPPGLIQPRHRGIRAYPRRHAGAFLTAARNGDFDALLEALDPDVVVRSNGTEAVRGAATVAARAFPFTQTAKITLPTLINGAFGIVTAADGRPVTLIAFTITGAKIIAIDLTDDPRRIAKADLAILSH